MYKELNAKIAQAQEDIAKHKELQNAVILLEREKESLQYNVSLLSNKLRKEKKDSANISAEYDLAKQKLASVQQKIDTYNEEKTEFSGSESELACLCDKKKAFLLDNPSQAPKAFIETYDKCETLAVDKKDLSEALGQLGQLNESVEKVEVCFNSAFFLAKPQGVRGLYLKEAKESYINDALRSIRTFNKQISSFNEAYINTRIGTKIKLKSLGFDSESLIKIMTWYQTIKNKRIAKNIILTIKSEINEITSKLISLQPEVQNDYLSYIRQLDSIIQDLK